MRKENSTNTINKRAFTKGCPLTATLIAIGGRWKVIIMWQLKGGTLRYNEIKKGIPNISEKMLIQQLKDLIQNGWVLKKDYNEMPPRTEYSLTKKGKSFLPIMEEIYKWGVKNKMG